MPYAWYLYRTLYVEGKTDLLKENTKYETEDKVTSYGPNTMVRNIKKAAMVPFVCCC